MEKKNDGQDPEAVRALVERGMAMADRIARRTARQSGGAIDVEDAIQTGRLALVMAARNYDASRGVPFEAWMARRVKGAVIDSVSQHTGLSRFEARTQAQQRLAQAASTGTHERLRYTMRLFSAPGSQQELAQRGYTPVQLVRGEAADHLIETNHVSGPFDDPQHQGTRREQARIARQMLRDMATEERKILTDYYLHGKSFRAISETHDISRSWLSRRHKRALEQLREQARVVMSLEMPSPNTPKFEYDPNTTVQQALQDLTTETQRAEASRGVPYRAVSEYSVERLREHQQRGRTDASSAQKPRRSNKKSQ